jgi:hypothetical protein
MSRRKPAAAIVQVATIDSALQAKSPGQGASASKPVSILCRRRLAGGEGGCALVWLVSVANTALGAV